MAQPHAKRKQGGRNSGGFGDENKQAFVLGTGEKMCQDRAGHQSEEQAGDDRPEPGHVAARRFRGRLRPDSGCVVCPLLHQSPEVILQ
jgi:hypothetical protein